MIKNMKLGIIFVSCLLFRLIPFRAPNLEPIMATLIPISRKYTLFTTMIFTFVSMVLYDFITGHVGLWTWVTAGAYSLVAFSAFFYFQKFQSKVSNLVVFTFFSTILFDLVTGVFIAPFFGVSMSTAIVLQIPFTLIHLLGNIGFALTLTPILNIWLASSKLFSIKKVSTSSALRGQNT